MNKMNKMIATTLTLCCTLYCLAFAQGKHTSRLDQCVRNCDANYKSCLSAKKKATYCSEKRRACRTACMKQTK